MFGLKLNKCEKLSLTWKLWAAVTRHNYMWVVLCIKKMLCLNCNNILHPSIRASKEAKPHISKGLSSRLAHTCKLSFTCKISRPFLQRRHKAWQSAGWLSLRWKYPQDIQSRTNEVKPSIPRLRCYDTRRHWTTTAIASLKFRFLGRSDILITQIANWLYCSTIPKGSICLLHK